MPCPSSSNAANGCNAGLPPDRVISKGTPPLSSCTCRMIAPADMLCHCDLNLGSTAYRVSHQLQRKSQPLVRTKTVGTPSRLPSPCTVGPKISLIKIMADSAPMFSAFPIPQLRLPVTSADWPIHTGGGPAALP